MVKKLKQKGYIQILIALLLVVALVGGGWLILSRRSSESMKENTNKQSNEDSLPQPEEWVTYKNEKARLTYQHPKSWTNKTEDQTFIHDGSYDGSHGTITAPNGEKLVWEYGFSGGSGGFCEPEPKDKPFDAGNKCSSKQIISAEKAQSIQNPANAPRNMFEDSLYITRTKYLSSAPSSEIKYQICLDPYKNENAPQPGTHMGLIFPCAFWKTGFYAKFEVKSETAFNSQEAKVAEKIMKSFNSF